MRRSPITTLCAIAAIVSSFWVAPLVAHHTSLEQYSASRPIELRGTVVDFSFRNPHSFLHLEVEDESGESMIYEIETWAPGRLLNMGIGADTFSPGEQISVNVRRRQVQYRWLYWGVGFVAADGAEYGGFPHGL
jgi:hypothetical protein